MGNAKGPDADQLRRMARAMLPIIDSFKMLGSDLHKIAAYMLGIADDLEGVDDYVEDEVDRFRVVLASISDADLRGAFGLDDGDLEGKGD